MRRREREITAPSEIEEILRGGKYAVLALCRNNEPYIVTLSYGYERATRSLYFHCAENGLKTDFVRENPCVCATVIQDQGYKQNECKQAYRSVVLRGRIVLVTKESEKRKAVNVLLDHLEENPEAMRAKVQRLPGKFTAMQIWRLRIEEITGKHGA
jgi:hypothetical protein